MAGLQADRLPYRGFLYFGLMLTAQGPKVLEFNCRFGDPECEAVMPLVGGDFAAYLLEGARGNLRRDLIHFRDGWSVCVVLASAGYPASSRSGDVIGGLESPEGVRSTIAAPVAVKTGNLKRMADGSWPSSPRRRPARLRSPKSTPKPRGSTSMDCNAATTSGGCTSSDATTSSAPFQ